MNFTVNFGYKRNRPRFTSLELEVPEGRTTVVCGHNGAGKTTLLKLISGILPSKMEAAPAWFVPASGGLIRHFSLKEHLDILEAYKREDWRDAYQLFGAEAVCKAPVRSLSTGQSMMASLVVAIASGKELLLLDEPFASLDPTNAQHLVAVLSRLERTVVITSHDLYLTAECAHRILFIKDGGISWQWEGEGMDVERLQAAYREFA